VIGELDTVGGGPMTECGFGHDWVRHGGGLAERNGCEKRARKVTKLTLRRGSFEDGAGA
jgi:hypothetical protein